MSEWGVVPPAFQRVADDLRSRIEAGELRPGDAIPPVSALITTYNVASPTVQRALRALKAAGLIESIPGKGTYVRSTARTISRSESFASPVSPGEKPAHGPSGRVEVSEVVPPDDVAELLGIGVEDPVVRRNRFMIEGGQVVEIARSYFPKDIADGTPLASAGKLEGAVPTALKRLGYPPRSPAREWVDARMPMGDEARILQVPAGVPVFRILRLTKTDNDRPVEVLEMILPGHRYRLEYDLPIHE